MEIPEHLLCRISDDLMHDPVVLESGFTFERAQILLHFKRNGPTCPMTRQQLNPDVLIPNQNIKQATSEFLVQNPWAFEYIPGQTLEALHM